MSKLRPADVVEMNKPLKEIIERADSDWDEPTNDAWAKFFAERERVFIPLLVEAYAKH